MFLIEIGFDKKSRYIISCISGYMLKNGHYFGKKDFEKLFDEIEKNPQELKALEIAKNELQSSFDIEKSRILVLNSLHYKSLAGN